MNDEGIIGGMRKVRGNGRTLRKPMHTVFVHQKSHMAQTGIEPVTPRTRGKKSLPLSSHRGSSRV